MFVVQRSQIYPIIYGFFSRQSQENRNLIKKYLFCWKQKCDLWKIFGRGDLKFRLLNFYEIFVLSVFSSMKVPAQISPIF